MTTTTIIYITGKTFECKNALREAGWKYNPTRKVWEKEAPAADLQKIAYGTYAADGRHTPASDEERKEFVRGLGGNRKGCAVFTAAHVLVWSSATYQAPAKGAAVANGKAQNAHDRAWGEGRYGNVSDHDYL